MAFGRVGVSCPADRGAAPAGRWRAMHAPVGQRPTMLELVQKQFQGFAVPLVRGVQSRVDARTDFLSVLV